MAAATLEQIVAKIRTAIFGKEIRNNIADGIEQMSTTVGNYDSKINTALGNFAGSFDVNTEYVIGDYVIYTNNKFYKITAHHDPGTAWASTSKTLVTTGEVLKACLNNLAVPFDRDTVYSKGTHVIYPSNGRYYVANKAHTVGVAWNNNDWDQVRIGTEITNLQNRIVTLLPDPPDVPNGGFVLTCTINNGRVTYAWAVPVTASSNDVSNSDPENNDAPVNPTPEDNDSGT